MKRALWVMAAVAILAIASAQAGNDQGNGAPGNDQGHGAPGNDQGHGAPIILVTS